LVDYGAEFVAVDKPHATRLTLHILAAVAEHEREMIAARTKAALQAAKAPGICLGCNGADRLAPAYRAEALERARRLAPVHRLSGTGLGLYRLFLGVTPRSSSGRIYWPTRSIIRGSWR
jgi:DNA invertase Pin-like site-specific DNA recombinase